MCSSCGGRPSVSMPVQRTTPSTGDAATIAASTTDSPAYYVQFEPGKWRYFQVLADADRYARTLGTVVQTREDVLRATTDGDT